MSTTPLFGTPELAEGQALPDVTHNEGLRRCEVLAARIVHFIRTEPAGDEAIGTVLLIDGPGTGVWAGGDWDNKIAFLTAGGWLPIPDAATNGADIPMGPLHAGLTFYCQDDGGSPASPVTKQWTGAAWITI